MSTSIFELDHEQLSAWLLKHKQQKFRAAQIFEWIYQHNVVAFEEMTNLPAKLREELANDFILTPAKVLDIAQDREITKLLLGFDLGGSAECVRIQMGNTFTACVSSQIGCSVGCIFCATGQTECERSLKPGEITGQVSIIRQMGGQVSNVVFMGMGEPFHNYANVVQAIRRLTDKHTFAMSPSRITVSTSGVVPGIRKYATEGLPTELTVSLNSPVDSVRANIMPGIKYSIAEILDACRQYSDATNGQPVTFAYVLMEGINDNLDDATKLAKLLRGQPHHLNIITMNPVEHTAIKAPNRQRAHAFLFQCRKLALNVSMRKSKGSEQNAACGQLRVRHLKADGSLEDAS